MNVKILSIAIVSTIATVCGVFLIRSSTGDNNQIQAYAQKNVSSNPSRNNDVEIIRCNYDEVIKRFNEEHGTSYKIADDDELGRIGLSAEDRDTFFQDMTEDEFYDYLNGLYDNDNNNLIINTPYYENADSNSGVEIEAKRVKDVYSDNGKVEFINENE